MLLERALDALLERELKRRLGAGKPRKSRKLKPDSRHIPVEIARQVFERDGGQCTFEDAEGRRCTERRFVTVEHRHPFALGGPPTLENLCLYCSRSQCLRGAPGVRRGVHRREARSARQTSSAQAGRFRQGALRALRDGLPAARGQARPCRPAVRTLRGRSRAAAQGSLERADTGTAKPWWVAIRLNPRRTGDLSELASSIGGEAGTRCWSRQRQRRCWVRSTQQTCEPALRGREYARILDRLAEFLAPPPGPRPREVSSTAEGRAQNVRFVNSAHGLHSGKSTRHRPWPIVTGSQK